MTGPEKDILLRVPQVGSDLLANIPRLQTVARIVLYQGKHFDGGGFPQDAVKGEEIPVEARILKVLADLLQLEAKKAPRFKALEQLQAHTGWYDPRVFDAVAKSFDLPPEPVVPQQKPVAVTFAALHAGQVLLSDVKTNDDVLIVTAGTRISPLLLERLKNFATVSGLKEPIYIES